MSTFNMGQLINHPALAGTWVVTHTQSLPHRHINVTQGSNTAQVTADDAVAHKEGSHRHVFACTDAWRLGRDCVHDRTDPNAQQMPEGDILYRGE